MALPGQPCFEEAVRRLMSGLLSHLLLNSVSAASKLDPKLESALKSHEVRAAAVETAIQYH